MGKVDRGSDALREVRASRIDTGAGQGSPVEERLAVANEIALTIDVEDVGSYTVLCTPNDLDALVLGFLFAEGMIESAADVAVLRPCETDAAVYRVRLKGVVPWVRDQARSLLIVSSCGVCGSEEMTDRLAGLPRVGNRLRIDATLLQSVNRSLRESQPLFDACGGTHAAGIFDGAGRIVSIAEDTGRHNALDKAVGKCLMLGEPTAGCGAVLSGRASLELVGKAARAGIELVSAISAPTSMAIDVAEGCGITLCAFVREDRATLFTHPDRLTTGR
jgi:FdhD protein